MSFLKKLPALRQQLQHWRGGNWPARWWKLAFFILLLLYLGQREWQFSIELSSQPNISKPYSLLQEYSDKSEPQSAGWFSSTDEAPALSEAEQKQADGYSNLGIFMQPDYIAQHQIPANIVAHKRQKCLRYIEKYAATAIEEREQFGIPASITLAQALWESNVGESQLATKEHNHFGIKCRQKCQGCRCANYSDDSRYDMFRVFESDWHSFRAHSKLLQGKRYRHLLKLEHSDYRNWAHGLKAAGYATDPHYAEHLIQIIEAFGLDRLDA